MPKLSNDIPTLQRNLSNLLIHSFHLVPNGDPFNWLLDEMLATLGNLKKKPSEHDFFNERRGNWLKDASSILRQIYLLSDPFSDPLGELYESLAAYNRKSFGQYFTPFNICIMLDRITGVTPDVINRNAAQHQGPLLLNDPAGGSGRCMLAPCKRLYHIDPSLLTKIGVYINDIDITCVKMMTVNFFSAFTFHNVELGKLAIFHGNTLQPDSCTLYASASPKSITHTNKQKVDHATTKIESCVV